MQTITIIIGLPGSGKSTYIKNNSEKFKNAVICDDYEKSTDNHKHSHIFRESIYFQDIRNALINGKDVVLSDIAWCRPERLEILKEDIKNILEELGISAKIASVYFENNPEACKINIIKRNRRKEKVEREIRLVDKLSSVYVVPNGINIIKIVN